MTTQLADLLPCCDLWCMNPAEFEIVGDSGHFEDRTVACKAHVGEVLGTPEWIEGLNQVWTVAVLEPRGVTTHE